MSTGRFRAAWLLLLAIGWRAAAARAATTFTVDTPADNTTAGDTFCSLREAVLALNSGTTVDACVVGAPAAPYTIRFASPITVTLTSALPAIATPVTIDATPLGTCTSADFGVVLTGSPALAFLGLQFAGASGGSVVRGLVMNRFTAAIRFDSGGNQVACSRLGTDATGLLAAPNRDGVIVVDGSGNVIGTDGDGVDDAAEGNVISANTRYGVFARATFLSNMTGTVIAGNVIGLGADGSTALGNAEIGIELRNLDGTRVGTNGDGVSDGSEGNVISANGNAAGPGQDSHGIKYDDDPFVQAAPTVIAGNRIGTDASGTVARPNGTAGLNRFGGILIESGADDVRIGTNGDGVADAQERNLIAGNVPHGLVLAAVRAHVAGNFIGVDATGTAALGNGIGVAVIAGAGDDNVIGTDGDGSGDELEGNVISGNLLWGVLVDGRGSGQLASGNRISGNLVGLGADGVIALGQEIGVYINQRTDGTLVGSDGDGTSDDLEVNRFAYNDDAIRVAAATGFVNTARCNLFGVDAAGAAAPNGYGVHVFSSTLELDDNFVHYSSIAGAQLTNGAFALAGDNAISCNVEGLDNTSPASIAVPGIWWGAADGPSGLFPGSGDPVFSGVDPSGFLTAPTSACGLTALANPCFPADLTIAKADTPDPVTPGTTLTYVLTITNLGPLGSAGGAATDTLPAGLTFVSSPDGCSAAGSIVTCPFPALAAGASVDRTLVVAVAPGVTSPISNTASVSPVAGEADPDPSNDSATAETALAPSADLGITKVAGTASASWGQQVVYTITVHNDGPSDAQGVVVDDPLPPELFGGTTVGCLNDPAGVPTCQLGTVAAGASAVYTLTATVISGTTVTNTATVGAATADPDGAESATSTIAAGAAAPTIPTLGEVALALLGLLLAGAAMLALRR